MLIYPLFSFFIAVSIGLFGLCGSILSQSVWADPVPFKVGDVFVGVGNGKIQHRDTAGTLVETLDTLQGGFTTGMAFDTVGNLYVTNFNAHNVRKFSNQGVLVGTFGSGYSGSPESILFDKAGNFYVGAVDGDNDIRKFDAVGNPLVRFNVATEDRGSDWIDLAADQCTMFYTSEAENIKRFNVCTNQQLPNFNTSPLPNSVAYALRILPDGGLLVANTSAIVRLDSAGNLVRTYDATGENCWFALNLDPDGKSFWTADFCSSNVYKFSLENGQPIVKKNTGTSSSTVFGLVIFGEITVARVRPAFAEVLQNSIKVFPDGTDPSIGAASLQQLDGTWPEFRDKYQLLSDTYYPAEFRLSPRLTELLQGVPFLQHGIGATFIPNFGFTLSEAASRLGFKHFNWFQLFGPKDPRTGILDFSQVTIESIDPNPVTRCNAAIAYVMTGIRDDDNCPTGHNRDSLPWYLDEQFSSVGVKIYDDFGTHVSEGKTRREQWTNEATRMVLFSDSPSFVTSFVTCLAGVRADGTGAIFDFPGLKSNPTCFTWDHLDGSKSNVLTGLEEGGPSTGTSVFTGFLPHGGFSSDELRALSQLGIGVTDLTRNINSFLNLRNAATSFNPANPGGCPGGVFSVTATFTNSSQQNFSSVFFQVATLTGGNTLLNADSSPGGQGSTVSVPAAVLGDNSVLDPNENLTQRFDVCLAQRAPFQFFVNVFSASGEGG